MKLKLWHLIFYSSIKWGKYRSYEHLIYYGRQMEQYYERIHFCNCQFGMHGKEKNEWKPDQVFSVWKTKQQQANKQNNNKLPKNLNIRLPLGNLNEMKRNESISMGEHCVQMFKKQEIIKCLSTGKLMNSGVSTNVVWFINKSNEILIYTMWPKE